MTHVFCNKVALKKNLKSLLIDFTCCHILIQFTYHLHFMFIFNCNSLKRENSTWTSYSCTRYLIYKMIEQSFYSIIDEDAEPVTFALCSNLHVLIKILSCKYYMYYSNLDFKCLMT